MTNNSRKNLDKVGLHLGVDALQKNVFLGQYESSERFSIQSKEQRSTAQKDSENEEGQKWFPS